MFTLSSVILLNMIGVDSCVFLIFTTLRVGLKTRLNGVKSIFFEQSQKVLVYVLNCFWFEKNGFPGDPQKHFGNSSSHFDPRAMGNVQSFFEPDSVQSACQTCASSRNQNAADGSKIRRPRPRTVFQTCASSGNQKAPGGSSMSVWHTSPDPVLGA